jgi:GT2 family glycosyltransferase
VYPKISIIVLNWNGLADTIECLESLRQITYPNYGVIVIDNGSSGDDAQVIKQKFGDYIWLIKNDKNYGFTGGTNIGIKYALEKSQPDYILSLNNDTIVEPQFLDRLVEAMEGDNSIGIAGSKVYYYDDTSRILSLGMMIIMKIGMAYSIGKGEIDSNEISQQYDVDYVDTCLLIRSDVIGQIGLFDESYFCYWEDADYCIRAKKAGYKVRCAPESKIWHKKAIKKKTIDKISEGMRVSASAQYYITRNSFRFMRRYATKRQYLSFFTFFFGCYFWLMLVALILFYRDTKRFVSFCKGIKDGVLGKDGIHT